MCMVGWLENHDVYRIVSTLIVVAWDLEDIRVSEQILLPICRWRPGIAT